MFEQERTLNRLQQRVSSIPGLTAAFLVGSMGRRNADQYADLDVVLVYRSAAGKEAARPGWPALAAELLPYVRSMVQQANDDPDHLIALYASGAKFDLYFTDQEAVTPHPRYQSIWILHDSGGWAQNLTTRSAALTLVERPVMSEAELAVLNRQFWIAFWELFRLSRRGEVDRPFLIYIRLMADVILPLLEVLPADLAEAQALKSAEFTRVPQENERLLQQLITHYRAVRAAVVERHQLAFEPDEAIERELLSRR